MKLSFKEPDPLPEKMVLVLKYDNRYFESEDSLLDYKASEAIDKIIRSQTGVYTNMSNFVAASLLKNPRRLYKILKEFYG